MDITPNIDQAMLDELVVNNGILYGFDKPRPWISDRDWITDKVVEEIINLFPSTAHMPDEDILRFISHFLFHFYGMQYEFKTTRARNDTRTRATVLRKELRQILTIYIRNKPSSILKKRDIIQQHLKNSSKMTKFLLGTVATHLRSRQYVKPDAITHGLASEEELLCFGEVLYIANKIAQKAVKPGGGKKPVYAQMTIALAYFFKDITGKRPTRITDAHSDSSVEDYPFIRIVRLMVQTIETNLPEELREDVLPDMTRTCRAIIRKIRLEEKFG